MAKGAAGERTLGSLHKGLARVMINVLKKYERDLETLDRVPKADIEEEIMAALAEGGLMPNPAMLSAISKFLKDNDIGFEAEEIDELKGINTRLEQRRKARSNVISLTTLDAV